MVVSCGIFLIKTLNLLLKTPFYYTINRSFCQYSCSFKVNLQLKPPFCRQNTHLFYTILLFLPKITHNFQLFYTIFTTFLLLLLYYYYYIIIILLLYNIIKVKRLTSMNQSAQKAFSFSTPFAYNGLG